MMPKHSQGEQDFALEVMFRICVGVIAVGGLLLLTWWVFQ